MLLVAFFFRGVGKLIGNMKKSEISKIVKATFGK